MIVTTTNSIENASIEKYIKLISTNVVAGTNAFSDFKASFTDVFGGTSGTYQKKLQRIYDSAIADLTQNAAQIGANAIIGLKIDFDEISGGNKSMLMISAVGMAVHVQFAKDKILNEVENEEISVNQLENELYRRTIINNISNDILLDQSQWNYLLNNPINKIIPNLIDQYIRLRQKYENEYSNSETLLEDNFIEYINLVDKDIVVNVLYSKITKNFSTVHNVLKDCMLYSPQKVLELIDIDLDTAIGCLDVQKNSYSKDDLILMKETLKKLNSLPDKGKIENTKGNMLERTREMFVCKCGTKNAIGNQYCYNCYCDIKGLSENQYALIKNFKLTVEALESLIDL